jgi:hypothetical protein
METEEERFVVKYFWMKSWRSKKIREELITTLGDVASGLFQVKI